MWLTGSAERGNYAATRQVDRVFQSSVAFGSLSRTHTTSPKEEPREGIYPISRAILLASSLYWSVDV